MKIFKHKRLYIIILTVFLLLFIAKAYYDTNCVEVRHYQIKNSSLGDVLGGLKVAHLSDLHTRAIGAKENKILELLKEEKPDLILITGDFINFEGPYEPVLSFLHQLKPPLGIYAVLGNTEYSNENGSCILCHEDGSRTLREEQYPIFLRNSFIPLEINGKVLNIIGVDDPVSKKSNLKTGLKSLNSEEPSILLAHSPEIFEEASGFGFDLILCGHTHGGQIFFTKYLKKIFPLEASLRFIEGFFQEGKTMMYVSRGLGTSFLPFRFGVKPEITFFSFSSNPMNTVSISNNPTKTIFTGLSLSSLIETFNILNVFDSFRLAAPQQHRSTLSKPSNPTNPINSSNSSTPTNSKILFDFESESELKQLNWECHKWFEISEERATSGRYSLKVMLPPGQYPGINFQRIISNWAGFHYFKMDVFNPTNERINFHIRIDDYKGGVEYANRFDTNFELRKGFNQISIPVDSIRTNLHHRPLNLKRIKRMIVFLMNNTKRRELYLDNIRLE